MAIPTDRSTFKEYCLRKLGKPVIDINVSDDQCDDRIDEALKLYVDYNYNGTKKIYYKQEITQQIKNDKFINMPDNIIGAVRIFPIANPATSATDMFNIRYQIMMNDMYTLTSVSMVPYYMTMQHLGLLEEMLVGQQPIRYSKHEDRLYIDTDWDKLRLGEFIIIEAYEVIDPEAFPDVWGDRWLQNFATALIKYQWGSNLTKFTGVTLPGGVMFNGERILSDSENEIEKLKQELFNSYTLPPEDMWG